MADERIQLVGWLDLQRAIVHWKCEGLSEQDAHRAVLPTSPLMTMAGIVSHLRWVERQCRISNEIIAQHSLEESGRHPDFKSAGATLRWMLIHMVEETARHAGHADIIRELLDGSKGYY